ncbi:type II toxin-antitoxin system VapC family toxin [Kibdelosporangium aridum]|nr:type II toxin-antitoxin system VapC family toxin [Kibdelosporangium aridum]
MTDRRFHVVAPDHGSIVTMVDTCVLLDVLTDDPQWADWSEDAIATARDTGDLVINPIIYAEVSAGFDTIEDLDEALPTTDFTREPLPYQAGFLASRAFVAYRRRGGARRSPLPDFYIGAHAAVNNYRLLTRDTDRFRTYFPKLELITPES